MKKLLALLILLTTPAWADLENPLNFREDDGSPDTYPYQVKVSNGTLTDNGDGTINITTGGGSGTPGGASTQVQYNQGNAFSADTALQWLEGPNTLVISRDAGQNISTDAVIISSDTGAALMKISHDGSIWLSSGAAFDPAGAGNNSIKIGRGSTAPSANQIVIGPQSTGGGADTIIIGQGTGIGTGSINGIFLGNDIVSTGAPDQVVCIGDLATCSSNTNSVCIGYDGTCDQIESVMIGTDANLGGAESIAIGRLAATTAANQLVFGGSTFEITDAYIGEGVTDASPVNTAINATGGSGSNIAGAALRVAAGKGTGNAAGGQLNLAISPRTTAGSNLQGLTDVIELKTSIDTVTITPLHPAMTGLVISGDLGQTGNLTNWENVNSTVLANVSPDGSAHFFALQLSTDLAAIEGGTGQNTYTKGDILVASSGTALTKLAVGTDGQILSADASQTTGVKWTNKPPFWFCGEHTTTRTGDFYMALGGDSSGTESSLQMNRMLYSGTFGRMIAVTRDSPGSTFAWTVTARKNTADTSVTCTIANDMRNCGDFSHTFSVITHDIVNMAFIETGTIASTTAEGFCIEFTPN